VIRGDALSVGLWLMAVAVGLLAGPVLGAWGPPSWLQLGPLVVFLAAACVGVGAALIRWNRSHYARLVLEVQRRFADHDPGDSPVSWVSTEVWRATNRFDPQLDPLNELQAEIEPLSLGFDQEPRTGAVTLPVLRRVTTEERGEACRGTIQPSNQTPSVTDEQLITALTSTPGRFMVAQPLWPVCCEALCVLESLTGSSGEAYLLVEEPDEDLGRDDREVFDDDPPLDPIGAHTYRCARCGALFSTHPLW